MLSLYSAIHVDARSKIQDSRQIKKHTYSTKLSTTQKKQTTQNTAEQN